MHEMSLCESIVKIIEDHAARDNFEKVKAVTLEIGELSHVEPESMRFCFSAIIKGTVAEGAELTIIRTPGEGWCMQCAKTVSIATRYDPCPHCAGHQVQVTNGDDMRLKELEVE